MYGGLSPRVRGNLLLRSVPETMDRSIPACAGEPNSSTQSSDGSAVYPRVCGGTVITQSSPCRYGGLSPRVRGNLLTGTSIDPNQRSIPACAGEPSVTRTS